MWFYITCIVVITTLTIEQIFRMKFKKDMYNTYLKYSKDTDSLTYDILQKVFNIGGD